MTRALCPVCGQPAVEAVNNVITTTIHEVTYYCEREHIWMTRWAVPEETKEAA